MNHPSRNHRAGRTPLGFLGAMVLILGVETIISGLKADTMDGSLSSYDHCRALANREARDLGVMAFGDSVLKHGIAPKVIQDRTGLRGYNFAIAGSQPPASYFLFREALAAGARPRAVLVDFFPCLINADPWANITNWPVVASYLDCFEMAWHERDSRLLADLLVRKTFPSVARRESIRAAIFESVKGFGGFGKRLVKILLRNSEENRGLGIEDCRFNPYLNLDEWAALLFKPVRCTPMNRHYIDKFMELAAEHDVKVFLVLPPYMPIMQAKLEQTGFDAGHEAFARSILASHPGLTVLDARKMNVEPYVFIDTHHLGYEGASTFSADVGEILRERLAPNAPAPGWITMPPYRKRPITVYHESIEESRLAVVQDEQKKRR